jgi:hypothetical protein
MSTPISLETVKAEFDHWRQHKKCSQSRIPKTLKQKALTLLAHYSRDEVVKTLKVPEHRLLSWEAPDSTAGKEEPTLASTTDFVPLSLPRGQPSVNGACPVTIRGTHAHGAPWSLQGGFTPAQLNAIVSALIATPGG